MDGEKIKKFRKDLDMTQVEFADHLDVAFQTVNRWEKGRSTPTNRMQLVLQTFMRVYYEENNHCQY